MTVHISIGSGIVFRVSLLNLVPYGEHSNVHSYIELVAEIHSEVKVILSDRAIALSGNQLG